MVLYLCHMCHCGLHAVIWLHIGTPMSLHAAEPRRTFSPLSVSLWSDLGDHIFDSVGLAGFKSRANDFFISLSSLYVIVSQTSI